MKYKPDQDLLGAITYGSRLYGTQTLTSDYDFKAVFLPDRKKLLLNRRVEVERYRFDVEGNTVSESETMPENGYEAEHVPVQKFVQDWIGGQAYAVEMVYAVLQGFAEGHGFGGVKPQFVALCEMLNKRYKTQNVQGMVGFAVKQTFDYVRRGERLNQARQVLEAVQSLQLSSQARLDDCSRETASEEGRVLDRLAELTGLEIGSTVNNNKTMRTLKLNGREYLETTNVSHFANAVQKLIDQYGDRSTRASETDVDWKSLSHAVRVYEQVLEFLGTGWITFPRPNTDFLRAVKLGQVPLELVKDRLRELDDQVVQALEVTSLPKVIPELRERLDDFLYDWLEREY